MSGDAKVRSIARKRPPRKAEIVATRMKAFLAEAFPRPVPEGVQPLNPGFFLLERMRAGQGAKKRSVPQKMRATR